MNTAGLSLSDAPSFRLIYPFFIASGIFGALCFLSFSINGFESRYDPYTIGSIHLFTIGFALNAIIGSLFQMLPVIGGVSMNNKKIALLSFAGVNLGTILFFCGYWIFSPFKIAAAIALGSTIIFAFVFMLFNILKKRSLAETIKGTRAALLSAFTAVTLGVAALADVGFTDFVNREDIVKAHIFTAIFGFVGALIVSIANQVLPMFYVTKEFPKFYLKAPIFIFIITVLFIGVSYIPAFSSALILAACIVFFIFGVISLDRLSKRKRAFVDASLKFWRAGLISLLAGVVAIIYSLFFELRDKELLFAALLGIGFFGSIIQAMINKIIPFLAWFHLANIGKFDAPSSREFIDDKKADIGFIFFASSIVLYCLATLISPLFLVASICAFASFCILSFNVIMAIRLYEKELLSVS